MLAAYEAICLEMNEQKRNKDQQEAARAEVKRVYEILEGSRPKLTDDATRWLVREGTFTFFEDSDGQMKRRHFYLLSDMLLVAEIKKNPTAKHRLRFSVALDSARLENKPDGSSYLGQTCLHSFILHSPTKSHLFFCESADDKQHLCAFIEKKLRK